VRYEGSVYRPPSEADSLILQATIGCAHNKCTFCSMYKDKSFRVRSESDIFEDLRVARKQYPHVEKFFIADGNALVMSTERLTRLFDEIKRLFPECKRVGIYASPSDILRKSKEDLMKFKSQGLGILYMGIESGSDEVLKAVEKGVSRADIIEAGIKVKEADIVLSVMIISGLGGKDKWREHAVASAEVINAIKPKYLGLLTLLLEPDAPLYRQVSSGKFQLLTPEMALEETHLFIESLHVEDCVFRGNHASNYISLRGVLPDDKERLLARLKREIECMDDQLKYKPRAL